MMDSSIRCINFNQDFSCLSIGTTEDYKVYNCDPFGECFHKNDDGGAGIVEMLFSTSLIAVVGLGDKPSTSTRRLKIINTKRKTVICDLTFPTSVLSVKLNRKRLIVVLFDQIYIYDVSCMKLLHTIETVPNKIASAALSSSDDSILCFPSASLSLNGNGSLILPHADHQGADLTPASGGTALQSHLQGSAQAKHSASTATGGVVVFDALNIQPLNVIQAHKASVAAICLSKDGKLVATASSKGTIIRVFNTQTSERLFEFRRGSYGALINSLSFDTGNTFLCCSSGTGTVHIFKLSAEAAAATKAAANDSANGLETVSSNEADREERVIPEQVPSEDEDNEELNQILNMDKSRAQGGKRTSSLSDLIWSTSSHLAKNVKGQFNNYLPTKVQSMLDPKRDFAYIKIPTYHYGLQNRGGAEEPLGLAHDEHAMGISTVVGINGATNHVMCADNHGNFYVYSIPLDKGGECILLKQFSFKE